MNQIYIAGAGGIGRALGLILLHFRDDVNIIFGDKYAQVLKDCAAWFDEAAIDHSRICYEENDFSDIPGNRKEIALVADCLPGSLAYKVATFALKNEAHYVNLTEHVDATRQIKTLAADASQSFVLQCGLAPGYINVLACYCYERWLQKTQKKTALEMTMRVGALCHHVSPPSYYGFTWSPIGVATEYVKPSIVVENNKLLEKPSLLEVDTRRIFGIEYEEALTSGGAASLPEYFKSSIANISYKTLRYPGHYAYVRRLLEKDEQNLKPSVLLHQMIKDTPMVQEDKVVIYASVQGENGAGFLEIVEKGMLVYGKTFANKPLKAIQTTTSGAMAQIIAMLLDREIEQTGPVFQHQLDTNTFLRGRITQFFYEA